MTKSTITRERAQQIFLGNGPEPSASEERELARMALAAMDSEPVAEVVSIYGDPEAFGEREIRPLVGIQQMPYGTKLYRHAQPAPVVPEEMTIMDACKFVQDMRLFDDVSVIVMRTCNACRAAMLQAGNSTVAPDTWIPVNESMPEPGRWLALYGQRVFAHGSDKGMPYEKPCVDQGYLGSDGKFYFLNWDYPGDIDDSYNNDLAIATHWMYWELPAAPQQEDL